MKLYKHQKDTALRLKKSSRFFDMSEPGTGKTRVQIEDVKARRAAGTPPALILATRSTLESAWADDFTNFAPELEVSVAYAKNREAAFAEKADAYITNHDAVNWLIKQDKQFWKRFDGGILIVDESTSFKHHTSQRSKNLAKLVKYFPIRRMMSGLPDPNGILDLWHQFFLLDGGERLGKSFFAFRSATCIPEQVGPNVNMVKWHEKDNIADAVAALVNDISIQHKFDECVDIPPNLTYTRFTQLTPVHTRSYREMEDEQITTAKDKVMSAVNKAVLRIKLLQIASGAVYDDEKEGNYVRFDTDRYSLVLDLIEECKHSVVFFQWNHQREELIKEATARKVKFAVFDGMTSDKARTQITKDFQAGQLDVIFAHPKSAAHGLTWTRGTRTIWASPTDNLEWWAQGIRRIYRIGQKEKTETIVVIARDTYDEIAWERLSGKQVRSDEFSEKLRRLL